LTDSGIADKAAVVWVHGVLGIAGGAVDAAEPVLDLTVCIAAIAGVRVAVIALLDPLSPAAVAAGRSRAVVGAVV